MSPRQSGELYPLKLVWEIVQILNPLHVHRGPVRSALADRVSEQASCFSEAVGVQGGGAVGGKRLGIEEQLWLGVESRLLVERRLGLKA